MKPAEFPAVTAAEPRNGTLRAWLQGLDDDRNAGPVPPTLFPAADPFAGIDWNSRRERILAALPSVRMAPPPPVRIPWNAGWVAQYGMVAAGLVLCVGVLFSAYRGYSGLADRTDRPNPAATSTDGLVEVGGPEKSDPDEKKTGREPRVLRTSVYDW